MTIYELGFEGDQPGSLAFRAEKDGDKLALKYFHRTGPDAVTVHTVTLTSVDANELAQAILGAFHPLNAFLEPKVANA